MLLAWTLVQGALAVAAAPAQAWVRQRSKNSFAPYYWRDPRQVLEVARPPAATGITADQFLNASALAARAWSNEAISCTSVNLTLAPEMTDEQIAGRDERNRIALRVGRWCRDPDRPTEKGCAGHNEDAIALTTLFTVNHPGFSDDGRILEGDIELNAVSTQWGWAEVPDPVGDQSYFDKYDLAGALTHEMGHFIGLDHTCDVDGVTVLIDDQGRPVPYCEAIPDAQYMSIWESTMYPRMETNSISWRSLTEDETNAACTIYPTTALPLDAWGGMGGCTAAASPAPRGAAGLVSALFGMLSLGLAGVLARVCRARRKAADPSP